MKVILFSFCIFVAICECFTIQNTLDRINIRSLIVSTFKLKMDTLGKIKQNFNIKNKLLHLLAETEETNIKLHRLLVQIENQLSFFSAALADNQITIKESKNKNIHLHFDL